MTKILNNKLILLSLALIIFVIAYWLISPIFTKKVADEALPVPIESNNFGIMMEDEQAYFEEAMLEMKDKILTMDEKMPEQSQQDAKRSEMIPNAHEVSGEALIVNSGDKRFLRFENLKTINGPDLRIYLSADLDAKDFVDLGVIRATEGNVNYEIPAGTDLTKYKYAMIWCRAFGVLFSYAEF